MVYESTRHANYKSRKFNGMYSLSYIDTDFISAFQSGGFNFLNNPLGTSSSLMYMPPISSKKTFKFQLLENIDYNAPQGIISYETPGGDGGLAINTGRKTESLILSGKIFTEYDINFRTKDIIITNNFNKIKKELLKIKNNGLSVELTGHPFLLYEERSWLIRDLKFGLSTAGDYLTFTADMVENRQANFKSSKINLVNSGNKLEFLSRLRASLS
ncbi:MAG: hypothetical protein PHW93_06625 [Candidatus Methanomethylophilaceae archaeon]|nr:hypothetical protein [Candidatus Methanomethylophilaceae archaeon]